MPAKVIFTSNTHPVRSFMGAKSNTVPRVARKKLRNSCALTLRKTMLTAHNLKWTLDLETMIFCLKDNVR